MSFGFRYHLASLMAVFFSLILGLLIGGALFPDNALVEEQGKLLVELEERFQVAQGSVSLLQAELDKSFAAWAELRDAVIPNRLTDKTAVLVQSSEVADETLLEALLTRSGAGVKRVKVEDLGQVSPTEDLVFIFPLASSELTPDLRQELASLVTAGANMAFLYKANNGPPKEGLPPSLVIDNFDTALGEIALILGLSLRQTGHYGWLEGSLGLFPRGASDASSSLDSGLQ